MTSFPTLHLLTSGTLSQIIVNIVLLAIRVGGVVAFIYILIGGYRYLMSGDSPDGAEKGKKTLTYAIVGLILVVVSYSIILYVTTEINKIK